MKKKILGALLLAFILVMSISGTVFAGNTQTEVNVSPINVVTISEPDVWWVPSLSGYNYWEGTVVHVSGSVSVTCTSEASSYGIPVAGTETSAESKVVVKVANPDGSIEYRDITTNNDQDSDFGLFVATCESDASINVPISYDLTLNQKGEWVIVHKGTAEASWVEDYFFLFFNWSETGSTSSTDKDKVVLNVARVPDLPYPWLCNGFTVFINDPYSKFQSAQYINMYSRELQSGIDIEFDGIRVIIPTGTIINGDLLCCASALGIDYFNGILTFKCGDMTFSNPVVIEDSASGAIIKSFTKICSGVAQ